MQSRYLCLALLFTCCLAAPSTFAAAANTGPESMVLQSTVDPANKPKPATFPHREHQKRMDCAECHHGKGADGKQTPYAAGQQIARCESCHNTKAEGMGTDYNTFQKVGHASCRECHRQSDAKLAKCTVCHKKE